MVEEHGADPNTSFLNHSALALAVRCWPHSAARAVRAARVEPTDAAPADAPGA